jgi:hypothetical protein
MSSWAKKPEEIGNASSKRELASMCHMQQQQEASEEDPWHVEGRNHMTLSMVGFGRFHHCCHLVDFFFAQRAPASCLLFPFPFSFSFYFFIFLFVLSYSFFSNSREK